MYCVVRAIDKLLRKGDEKGFDAMAYSWNNFISYPHRLQVLISEQLRVTPF